MTELISLPFMDNFPYAGLFVLLILGGVGFPFPEDATLILCGFLISINAVNPAAALIDVYAGLIIGDYIVYSIGKRYGRRIVTHKRFQKFLSPQRFASLEEKFAKNEVLLILFGRHFIGLRVQIFLAAGIMRMSAVKFVLTDALTSILTMAVMVGAGYAGGSSLAVIKKDITRIEHFAILAIVICIPLYLLYRYIRSKRIVD